MDFLTIILIILIVGLALVPICLHTGILIKDLAAKRSWILILVLMILAISLASIIEARTGSFAIGLISALVIYLLGFLPLLYIDHLKKSNSTSYKGVWQKAGDWFDQPIKQKK